VDDSAILRRNGAAWDRTSVIENGWIGFHQGA
jgi:hypothetical protein